MKHPVPLWKWRMDRGLTTTEMGRLLDQHHSVISRLETGRAFAGIKMIVKLECLTRGQVNRNTLIPPPKYWQHYMRDFGRRPIPEPIRSVPWKPDDDWDLLMGWHKEVEET